MTKNAARDRYRFDVLRDGPVSRNLGAGDDEVVVRSRDKVVDQVRLTFVRGEVGDGNPYESGSGGLAVGLPTLPGRFEEHQFRSRNSLS